MALDPGLEQRPSVFTDHLMLLNVLVIRLMTVVSMPTNEGEE